MIRCGLCLITCLLLLLSLQTSATATTWYIKADGTGDAPTIQAGVNLAQLGDTVLVAPGWYSYTNQGATDYAMIMIPGRRPDFAIVSEGGPSVTVLDGESQCRILFLQGYTDLTVDGFTFTRGQATLINEFWGGAWVSHLCSPTIKNCVFTNSWAEQGAGIWHGGVGTPQILDCKFVNNTATHGGGILVVNSPNNSVISGCTFKNNSASDGGGAILAYNFRVSIEDCLFDGNSAAVEGGGVSINNSYPTPINGCTFSGNTAPNGGGVASIATSTVMVDRSIIASSLGGGGAYADATSAITFSCTDIFGNVGGDWIGAFAGQLGTNGNISADPRFCSAGGGVFTLQESSPCAPGNHPDGDNCGTIGRFGVACGTVDIKDSTWGAIKSLWSK
jgi:predicted outer membrane repeat protein